MSLPPLLLARLAQRGLVEQRTVAEKSLKIIAAAIVEENEEVIAEDYDEIDGDDVQDSEEYQNPSQYEDVEYGRKRNEDNYWLECMKVRMSEVNSVAGYKGCPNKYNIWHKCTLYCVNRWADGKTEPTREYLRRFKRLIKKYPLPDGWNKIYDPGCGCFYFTNTNDNVVSWLPPTHPKSIISKSAATLRRQLEESAGGDGLSESEQEASDNNDDDTLSDEEHEQHEKRSNDKTTTTTSTTTTTTATAAATTTTTITTAAAATTAATPTITTRRSRSPPTFHAKDFPSLHDAQQQQSNGAGGGNTTRKQKTRKN